MNEDSPSSMVIKSCSSKSELSETPTLSPPQPDLGLRESGENRVASQSSGKTSHQHSEQPETEIEKLLKKERRHLVVQLDNVSEKHQYLLKVNAELRKSLESERSKVSDLEKELQSMVAEALNKGTHLRQEMVDVKAQSTTPSKLSEVSRGKGAPKSEVVLLEQELERLRAECDRNLVGLAKAEQEKADLETRGEKSRSQLSQTLKESEGLKIEVAQLESELESMKAKLVGSDEKRVEFNHRLTAKEVRIGELEKDLKRIRIDREKAVAEKDGELKDVKEQLGEIQEAAAAKGLEILHLRDRVHNLEGGEKFVKVTFDGLSHLETEAKAQKQFISQRFDHILTQIGSFKSYMGENLYKYASDEEQ